MEEPQANWSGDSENKFTAAKPYPHPLSPSNWDSHRWSGGMWVQDKHKLAKQKVFHWQVKKTFLKGMYKFAVFESKSL